MTEPLLAAEGLSLTRGLKRLFADLSFSVTEGDLLLLRGENGSGKSSLLRALAGLLGIESGTLTWRNPKPALRYLGHQDGLKSQMTVAENLAFLEELSGGDFSANIRDLNLPPLMDRPVADLSARQRRRTALARLTAGDGALWLIDEPATSLDDAGKAWLWRHVAAHRAAGGAVIAAVHDWDAPEDAKVLRLGRAKVGA